MYSLGGEINVLISFLLQEVGKILGFFYFVFSGRVSFFILVCVLHRRIQCVAYVMLKEILLRCLSPQCHRLFS